MNSSQPFSKKGEVFYFTLFYFATCFRGRHNSLTQLSEGIIVIASTIKPADVPFVFDISTLL